MQQQKVSDSYVGRQPRGSDTGSNDPAIARSLAAKSNAVRRLETMGRRAKFSQRHARSASAA